MYAVSNLHIPSTLAEALEILANNPAVRPLAGGTDLVVQMRHKKSECVELMSLHKLSEFRGITLGEDERLQIGALCTFTDLAKSPIINAHIPMLKTAALSMGGPQIQNTATIGGNVCNGATSADSAPPLLAYDAVAVLVSKSGTRRVPLREFYVGPGKVVRRSDELLSTLEILTSASRVGDCYIKFATRKALDLSITGVAATCTIDAAGAIEKATLALGVAAPTPIRMPMAEAFLVGKRPTAQTLADMAQLALSEAQPRDSWRGSKAFRTQLILTLSQDAMHKAYSEAGGEAT